MTRINDKNALLIIIGEGTDRLELENKIKQLTMRDRIRMIGFKPHDELKWWLTSADLFCLVSSREGWPTVFFEAFACGNPIVATKVWGAPEVIKSDDYGFLVDNQDPILIAEAIIGIVFIWAFSRGGKS